MLPGSCRPRPPIIPNLGKMGPIGAGGLCGKRPCEMLGGGLGLRRRQIAGDSFILKPDLIVRAVALWL